MLHDKVISGFGNKAQVAIANLIPESIVAAQVHKQQAPADK